MRKAEIREFVSRDNTWLNHAVFSASEGNGSVGGIGDRGRGKERNNFELKAIANSVSVVTGGPHLSAKAAQPLNSKLQPFGASVSLRIAAANDPKSFHCSVIV